MRTKSRTRFMQQTWLVVTLLLCLQHAALARGWINQEQNEVSGLEPGQPVEREIAGGESHVYQISLTAGQLVRFRVEQRAIDAALTLTEPDGKQLVKMNLTGAGDDESLSLEAAAAGSYRLTVRGEGAATSRGSYRLGAAAQAKATAQDRKRLTAEALLIESSELRKQGAKTAQQVVEKAQQALPVWRELGDLSGVACSLYLMASAYLDMGLWEKAIEYNEQALAISREGKLRASEARSRLGLSYAYNSLRRYEKGIEHSEQALVVYREMKNRQGEGIALNNLGNAYRNLGRPEKAIEFLEQALTIHREARNRGNEGKALYDLGAGNMQLGRHEKAIEFLEQALAIYREDKNRKGEASALSALGSSYINLSRHEKASESLARALTICREIKNRQGEATALNNLGFLSTTQGQNGKAIEYFEQALQVAREIKDRSSEQRALGNLGATYSRMGRVAKAIEYFEQGLQIARELKNNTVEAIALINLGDSYNHLGQYPKAIEYSEQALALSRGLKNRVFEAVALNNMGDAYAHSNRHEKAIEYYEQALGVHREVKNRREEGVTLTGLSNMRRQLGQTDKAAESGGQALAILREIGALDLQVAALYTLAQTERDRGNGPQARTFVEESLGIAESMRAGLISPESRTSFLATVQNSYVLYTDLLMRQHRAEPTKGFDALAVEVSERQRARSLLDLLSEARADLRRGVDAALLERERSLGKQLNDKAQRLTQANKPEQAAALKQQISQLETDYELAQADIRKNNPHYAAVIQPQPLKLKEIQQQLDADTLLLEYALGEERSYLWAITKDSLASYELAKGEQIQQSALQVYELLTARSTGKSGESEPQRQARITRVDANLSATAAALSRTLLAPVAAQLGNKRLVIVADGALQYIPFAMLPDPVVAKNQPLILNHEIVSLPSASALAIQRAELAGRRPAPKMLAVIADPVFERSDVRFTTPALETNEKQEGQTSAAADDARSIEHLAGKSDDKFGATTRRVVIPRLPFTRQEATRLLALTPKESSFGAIDFQASRATVLKGDLSQYRYVHFATHGVLDSERPGLSSLVLSMVDAEGKQQDGFLRANDIYNLKLPAELVVLSACQTGLGKEVKGEGLVGLTRGFMYAGAARVVVSLWSVNDKATADLMAKFYERMLKRGERPAAALRAAQVEMWRQKAWQSPYYWAAFTMQGEWR